MKFWKHIFSRLIARSRAKAAPESGADAPIDHYLRHHDLDLYGHSDRPLLKRYRLHKYFRRFDFLGRPRLKRKPKAEPLSFGVWDFESFRGTVGALLLVAVWGSFALLIHPLPHPGRWIWGFIAVSLGICGVRWKLQRVERQAKAWTLDRRDLGWIALATVLVLGAAGGTNILANNGTFTGSLVALSIDGVQKCDQFPGATFDVKVNACITAAIASSGVADATGLTGNQTIAAQINLGVNATAPSVTLILSPLLVATVTITDGVSCGIKAFSHSSLMSEGTGNNPAIIQAGSSFNGDSIYCTDPSPVGGGGYYRVRGVQFANFNNSGTFANGVMHVQNTFDGTLFEQVTVSQYLAGGLALVNAGTCCSTTYVSLVLFGNNVSGPLLTVNSATASTIGLTFVNWSAGHPGTGQHIISINCSNAGNCAAINSIGLYMENNPSDSSTALVEWTKGTSGFFQGTKWVCTNSGASTAYLFDLASSSSLRAFKAEDSVTSGSGNCTNIINDHVNSETKAVTSFSTLSYYGFGDDSYNYLSPLRVLDGSCTTPDLSFFNENSLGIDRSTSGTLSVCSGGNQILDVLNGAVKVRDGNQLQLGTAGDTSLTRNAAGVVQVGASGANSNGTLKADAILAGGSSAGFTGTGACATFSNVGGGGLAGTAKCTGTTGASTITITPGTTAPNGWACNVQDETTRANVLQQTSHTATTCVLTATSITQNDVVVFSAIAF